MAYTSRKQGVISTFSKWIHVEKMTKDSRAMVLLCNLKNVFVILFVNETSPETMS